jgi:hypothetical protein
MSGAPSIITVYKSGGGYRVTVAGRFGGGFATTRSGDPAEVAPFVAAQMQRYAQTNPHGGSLVAPPEIANLIPANLREVLPRRDRP